MTHQLSFSSLVLTPVVVPTVDVDYGEEYCEGEPVYWNGESWNVLDWDFDHNSFVLMNDKDWETYRNSYADIRQMKIIRDEILSRVWMSNNP